MMQNDVAILRTAASVGLVCFIALNVSLFSGWLYAEQFIGIPWHLCLLAIVTLVDTPLWARANGYAWLAIDLALAGAVLQGFPAEMATQLRFGGAHICTAIWVAGTMWGKGTIIKVIGGLLAAAFMITALIPLSKLPLAAIVVLGVLMFSWIAALAVAGERVLGREG